MKKKRLHVEKSSVMNDEEGGPCCLESGPLAEEFVIVTAVKSR